jgi:hypothetical protein
VGIWGRKKRYLDARLTDKVLMDQEDGGKRYRVAFVPEEDARQYVEASSAVAGQDARNVKFTERLWARLRPHYTPVTSDAADESTSDVGGMSTLFGRSLVAEAYYDQVKQEEKRGARYDDYLRINTECVIGRRGLKVTVDNVYTSAEGDETTWRIESDDEQIQNSLEEVDKRVEMHTFAPAFCRGTLLYGDGFCEPVVDNALKVVRLKWLSPKFMFRNEDRYGRLHGDAAFEMKDDAGEVYAQFKYFQCVHVRYDHEIQNRYGTSFYFTIRRPWRQREMGVDGVLITRLSKANRRFLYKIALPPGTPHRERQRIVNELKEQLRRTRIADDDGYVDRRKKPMIEENDIFLPVDRGDDTTDVRMYDPGGMNDNLADIDMLRDDMIVAIGVPPAYLGLDKEVRGRAHLGWIDIEFARMLRGIQKMMAGQFQRRVYDLQLLLDGTKTDEEQYRVVYPPISFVDEKLKLEIEHLKWQIAVTARAELGLPTWWVLRYVVGLDEKDTNEVLGDQDFHNITPGAQAAPPAPTMAQKIKDDFVNNMKIRDELSDMRDRLMYVVRHGLNKEVAL